MEGRENDLSMLREHIVELLDNILDIGVALNKKSSYLLRNIANVNHTDINGLERIGLAMVKLLKTLSINVADIANVLENDLERLNENGNEPLLKNLCLSMAEYKTTVTKTENNSNTSIPSKRLDKNIQTDNITTDNIQSDVPNSIELQLKIDEVKSEIESNTEQQTKGELSSIKNALKLSKAINLSLIRTDTQDTDDSWIDSLNRTATALELWNKKYEGEKIEVTDEYLDQLKKEQNEEEDRKSENMNYDEKTEISNSDDTFVDGQSVKSEVNEVSLIQELPDSLPNENPQDNTAHQLLSSVMVEKTTNESDLLQNCAECTMENRMESVSKQIPTCQDTEPSQIGKDLNVISTELKPSTCKIADENITSVECNNGSKEYSHESSTQSPSSGKMAKIIPENFTKNIDLEKSENAILDKIINIETNKSNSGTLDSINEEVSIAMTALAEQWEAVTSIDPPEQTKGKLKDDFMRATACDNHEPTCNTRVGSISVDTVPNMNYTSVGSTVDKSVSKKMVSTIEELINPSLCTISSPESLKSCMTVDKSIKHIVNSEMACEANVDEDIKSLQLLQTLDESEGIGDCSTENNNLPDSEETFCEGASESSSGGNSQTINENDNLFSCGHKIIKDLKTDLARNSNKVPLSEITQEFDMSFKDNALDNDEKEETVTNLQIADQTGDHLRNINTTKYSSSDSVRDLEKNKLHKSKHSEVCVDMLYNSDEIVTCQLATAGEHSLEPNDHCLKVHNFIEKSPNDNIVAEIEGTVDKLHMTKLPQQTENSDNKSVNEEIEKAILIKQHSKEIEFDTKNSTEQTFSRNSDTTNTSGDEISNTSVKFSGLNFSDKGKGSSVTNLKGCRAKEFTSDNIDDIKPMMEDITSLQGCNVSTSFQISETFINIEVKEENVTASGSGKKLTTGGKESSKFTEANMIPGDGKLIEVVEENVTTKETGKKLTTEGKESPKSTEGNMIPGDGKLIVNVPKLDPLNSVRNLEEDETLSQDSNKSFVFDVSKSVRNIENISTSDAPESTNHLTGGEELSKDSKKPFVIDVKGDPSLVVDSSKVDQLGTDRNLEEEDSLSHGSNKSFVFDISESIRRIDKENAGNVRVAQKDIVEHIEILSDSEEEVQLEVTMEEIISPASVKSITFEHHELKIEEVEEEHINAQQLEAVEDSNIQQNAKPTKQQIIGDELLELLREVEVPSIQPLSGTTSKNQKKMSDKTEMMEANEIIKSLMADSSSDFSDSDGDDNSLSSSCSDIELDSKFNTKMGSGRKSKDLSQDNSIIPEVHIKDCYISIPKLELDIHDVIKVDKKLDDSIDRLCDLSSILNKRKITYLGDRSKSKRIKKSVTKKGTSDPESLSDFTHSDSDNAPNVNSTLCTGFNEPLEQKLDDMLANEICKVLKSSSSNESSDVDSDSSNKISKKAKYRNKEKTVDNSKQKRILSKEERMKEAWKNDPLLRGKLTSDDSTSSSSSDSDKSFKRRKSLRARYEHDTDFYILSDETDLDSDNGEISVNKVQLESKHISPIKRNIPVSDSSDTDSDIEMIVPTKKTPEKDSNEEETELNSAQKGRRNIRALMSDESLTEATQRANKEEQERIERLEDRHRVKESLSQSFSQILEEETLVLDIDEDTAEPLIKVHPKLNRRLKPHQKLGIQFMWDSCYESLERLKVDKGSGCILAHCMGLGKTFQVITLLHTLFSYEETNTNHVLVVCPMSTVSNWKKEVKIAFKHFSDDKLNIVTILDKKELSQKYDIVKKWFLRNKSVLVLGYECFESMTNDAKLGKLGHHLKERLLEALIDPGPDLVVCDEGHLLRNKKALKTLALNKIKTKRRIVLTGTPLQNNLLEYYYMVDFVKPNLLGNMKEYKTNFVNPITNGQYEDSTAEDIKLMMKRTHVLHKLLKKTIQRVEDTELKIYLPRIVDHAVFIQLHQVQVNLYNKFSQLVKKGSGKANRKGFLSDFAIFQYICTHPHLLAIMENLRNKRIKERDLITNEQEDNPICNIEGWWKAIVPSDAAEKIDYGHKMMVLKFIIEECEEIGDKILVFSQSLGELDLIEHFLAKEGTARCRSWKKRLDYSRMDGTISPSIRSTICDLFNDKENKKLRLLLMSTRVGGLGLNLTAANRVVIMTVNWNPSYDIQSVFRVYRFGQEKEVFVYRLIALDSMEEKVYQRTVTKLAIAHRVVDKHQVTRHYKSMDLQEMYSCRPNADVERPICNVPEDKILAKLMLRLPCIFKQHEHQALLANRPEDNLNEQELNAAWDEFKKAKDAPQALPPLPPIHNTLPPISVCNGPTFSMAYDLIRPTTLIGNQKISGPIDSDASNLANYYIPTASGSDPMKKTGSSMKSIKSISKIPKKTAISLEEKENPRMASIPPAPKNTKEQDPLYIPQSEVSRTVRSYTEKLTMFNQGLASIPKLPASTTIVLDDSPDKNTEINNTGSSKPVEPPKRPPVVRVYGKNKYGTWNHKYQPAVIKRKRNREEEKQTIFKRMRDNFNQPTNSFAAINVDDDDVSVIPDTASESGSLSNELITNLGRSGITVHKVLKNSNVNKDTVITLD